MSDLYADTPDWEWQASVTTPDGKTHDVTRELAVLYDAIVGSMDWGSSFLDKEDVDALFRIASLCGFTGAEYSRKTGYPILLDAEGGVLNEAPERWSPYSGWAEDTQRTNGRFLKVRSVVPSRSGTVTRVRLNQRGDHLCYKLSHPIEVTQGQALDFEVPIT